MLKRIAAFRSKSHGVGATEDEIAAAEDALGVRFPESYRRFLEKVGWGEFAYQSVYGLGIDVPRAFELVRNALSERYEFEPNVPSYLVPVMNDGAGNHYCLDTARMFEGECPVVFWDHEHEGEREQTPALVADSFDCWLIDLLADLPGD